MYSDDDLIAISGLQHLMFCERQWALIHMEQEWSENVLTIEGRQLHEFVHGQGAGVRGGMRTARGLRLRSLRLGLYGVADLVEFHDGGIPYPVEYKRGRKRPDSADEVQLCAQAICLEEMLGVSVSKGAVYHGEPRRRIEVELDTNLRAEVERLCLRARELYETAITPPPAFGKRCSSCSIQDICCPKAVVSDGSSKYVSDLLQEAMSEVQLP
ncbi:MAG: CRISPR-associated protein Cas4 [Synergistaceae bacterium]|jgi:CRISPR-associated exonuclease Cas4|nr:CRISPR-associated protein Cas4 [Synergistaceae bacterium]